jgi:hypothetical protein
MSLTVPLVPGHNVWLLAGGATDAEQASQAVMQLLVQSLGLRLGHISLTDGFKSNRLSFRTIIGEANPTDVFVFLPEQSEITGLEARFCPAGRQLADAQQHLGELPLLQAQQVWLARVHFDWRGQARDVAWPTTVFRETNTVVGRKEQTWLLRRACHTGAPASEQTSFSEEVIQPIADDLKQAIRDAAQGFGDTAKMLLGVAGVALAGLVLWKVSTK